MPSSGCASGTLVPVQREVRIHALAKQSDVVADPAGPTFFTEVHTPVIATVHSDDSGFYQADLPPGSYSVFVVENGKLYANGFGEAGIAPVTINDAPVELAIDINYQASY